jgi:pilus assembly protein CpaB
VGNRRTLIAAAAIVLAAVSGIGVYLYVSSADKRAEDQVELVQAYVAAGDIPKGMSGEAALANGLIEPKKVLRGSVPPAAVTDSGDLGGKVAAATIQTRQFITSASFVSASEGGGGSLAASIGSSGRVAVTISVDAERGVAHSIAPGDRVDILVVAGGDASVLLDNVKVLAVGQETAATANSDEPGTAGASSSGLITFELTPEDARQVVAANSNGSLYLTLRPLATGGGTDRTVPASGIR